MTDEELRQLFAALATSLTETNASIKETNVRLAYMEGEAQADRARIRRVEEAVVVLTELSRNIESRQEASERRLELMEVRQDKADEAVASLSRTVERYINARSKNGDKPE